MIDKIKLIKNVGNYEPNVELTLVNNKMNIIYGLNATGKTTLTKLLKANSSRCSLEEKERLKKIIKSYDTEENLDYKIEPEEKRYIKVFDADYIREKIGMKSFDLNKFEVDSGINEDLNNPLEKEYLKYKNEMEKVTEEEKNIKEELPKEIEKEFDIMKKDVNMTRKINDDFRKNIYDKFKCENIIDTDKKINILKKYAAISKVGVENKILDFDVKYNELDNIFVELRDVLKFNEEVIDNTYIEEVLSITNQEKKSWILEGIKHVKIEDGCPFCKSKQNMELLNGYKKYEQSKIKETRARIENLKKRTETFIEIYVNNKMKLTEKIFQNKDLIEDYDKLSNFINNMYEDIQSIYEELKSLIDNKYENINVDCSNLYNNEKLDAVFIRAEKYSENIKSQIIKINNIIDKSAREQENLRKEYLENIIIPTIAEKTRSIYDNMVKKEKDVSLLTEKMRIAYEKYKKDLEEKNILIKAVNTNLKLLNIEKYSVNSKFQLELKNKDINSKYKSFLSEGEKTSIALALFLSEIETSKGNDKISMLVFDDPISSFDYDNIYNIYYLIKEKWCELRGKVQFLILTHNNVFYNCLKYSSDICEFKKLVKTTNAKIKIEKDKLIKSIYMEKLRCINTIKNSQDISIEQKLYIPNFCRYIFETQANFLYPNVEDSMKCFSNEIISKDSIIGINKTKLNSYLGMCNTGSHSQVTEMIDGEDVIDYKQICNVCIRITKHFFNEQINNI